MTVSVGDVSLQVGAVDATDRPSDVPNAIKTRERADATRAPAITGAQWTKCLRVSTGVVADGWMVCTVVPPRSAQAQERQDKQDHDNQTDQINQPTHVHAPRFLPLRKQQQPPEQCSLKEAASRTPASVGSR